MQLWYIGLRPPLFSRQSRAFWPLRSDIVLRFAPDPYHPLDPANMGQYVVDSFDSAENTTGFVRVSYVDGQTRHQHNTNFTSVSAGGNPR
jgi:hypothetical protein